MSSSLAKMSAYLLLLGLLCAVCGASEGDESTASNITVSPSNIKLQTGFTVKVICSLNEAIKLPITWLNPNGTDVQDMNNTRITHDGNGTLTITEALVADSGQYTCRASDSLHATADIVIYIMPSYFMQGLVILGINGVLLIIFLGCLAHSQIQQRRNEKGLKYTEVNKKQQRL